MYAMSDSLSNWFDESDFGDSDDLFSILESLEGVVGDNQLQPAGSSGSGGSSGKRGWNCSSPSGFHHHHHHQELLSETEELVSPKGSNKRQKVEEGQNCRISHITVERNRRKQMNEHLSVLRSLMPCFYVKRGDQASIIGGVVDYITELQQILQSLEAKKQRKVYSVDVLSPRLNNNLVSSPRPLLPLSPRKPPISPRLNLPISPRTPQPGSPYPPPKPSQPPPLPYNYSPTATSAVNYTLDLSSPSSSSTTTATSINSNDLTASSRSAVAEVEVKFSGANLVLKTKSFRFPGQVMKIVAALEELSLEILQVNVNTVEETMLINSFTIKIGIECRLSAEELAQQIQQTFCLPP